MKLLILENTRKHEDVPRRITLENMRTVLNSHGIHLQPVSPRSPTILAEDACYIGQTPSDYPQSEICLRTIYVPPEYGRDYFATKLRSVIREFRPDCILSHLALYGRAGRFRDYPAIKVLLPYAEQEKKRVIVYTGTADDGLSLSADTGGCIEFYYNNRKIEPQIDFILKLLRNAT